MEKIVLGLSDGVDSAVAAVLLKQQGFDVLGVFLDIGMGDGWKQAEQSAREAGIGFLRANIEKDLHEKVCEPFIKEYLAGRTPSPCVGCNRDVKLPGLLRAADCMGITKIATGHYVRMEGSRLYMGDESCDQSYMLSRLTPEEVRRLVLPLGAMKKADVRALAASFGLTVAGKPDSRENCFIKDSSYADYIEKTHPAEIPPEGNVLFRGEIIGSHRGIHRYTVGQRWEQDMGERRAYVSDISAETNEITLALWEDLFTTETNLSGVTFLAGEAPAETFEGRIRVRHTRWETPACKVTLSGDRAHIVTETPLRAPAPGQSAALYIGNELIGGGIVEK